MVPTKDKPRKHSLTQPTSLGIETYAGKTSKIGSGCKNPKSQQKSTLTKRVCARRSYSLRAAQLTEQKLDNSHNVARGTDHPCAQRRCQNMQEKCNFHAKA
ncbi:hypothetical protein A2U01_0061573 [Trifolium medium]|uniref:Uncharacterized protein n=1 Tax=Trifolium medium TaxID=97028 RepID=A0A392RX26_9FABA|nr:hypothetical protein [Trifolium medium]